MWEESYLSDHCGHFENIQNIISARKKKRRKKNLIIIFICTCTYFLFLLKKKIQLKLQSVTEIS